MTTIKDIRGQIVNAKIFIFDWDGVFVKNTLVKSLVVSYLFNNKQVISNRERVKIIKNLQWKFKETLTSGQFSFNEQSFQKIFEPNFHFGINRLGLPDRHDIYPLFTKECLLKVYPTHDDTIQLFNELKDVRYPFL